MIGSAELTDGRHVGLYALEVTACPEAASLLIPEKEALQQNALAFERLARELHALCNGENACFEVIWLAQDAARQAVASRVRLLLTLRVIAPTHEAAESAINTLAQAVTACLEEQKFLYAALTDCETLRALLSGIDPECTAAIVKAESYACAQNGAMVYTSSVIPGDNADDFRALLSALSQARNCSVSFQLIPTAFTPQERAVLHEQHALLSGLSAPAPGQADWACDPLTGQALAPLRYYLDHAREPIYQYALIVSGSRSDCAAVCAKLVSLLKSGGKKAAGDELTCLDISRWQERPDGQLMLYPFNTCYRLMYELRNLQVLEQIPVAGALMRLPYLASVQEAAALFRLPLRCKGMLAIQGHSALNEGELLNGAVTDPDALLLGQLYGKESVRVGCPAGLLNRHMLIVGAPGFGKTNFSLNLLYQLHLKGIPFLAIEPTKAEYRSLLTKIPSLQIFTPGNSEISPFPLNPFVLPSGIRLEQHKSTLMSAFKVAFPMDGPLESLFNRAIGQCYIAHGWKDYSKCGDADVTPFGLREFIICFRRIVRESDYSAEVKGNIASGGTFRLLNLIQQNSAIFDTIHAIPIEDLLQKPTVIELNAIENSEQKALVMALLLVNVGIYIRYIMRQNAHLRNVVLIDEAHVLLDNAASGLNNGPDAQGATARIVRDMIAEVRACGTGVVIADQDPCRIGRSIVGNTLTKVVFRLAAAESKQMICASMGISDGALRLLGELDVGEAYVYNHLFREPQLVVTPYCPWPEVSDDAVCTQGQYWPSRGALLRPYAECDACPACARGCGSRIRSLADYCAFKYREKFAALIREKVKNAADGLVLIRNVRPFIKSLGEQIPPGESERLILCAQIALQKWLALERGIDVPLSGMQAPERERPASEDKGGIQ